MLASVEDRVMFDGRSNDMVARPRQPKYRQIVAFRATAGKHDFRSAAAKQCSHRFARALDGGPRLLSMMVDGGRVAEVLAEVRPHGLQHFGEHRCGRIVVEIDPAHHAASIVLMRGATSRSTCRDGACPVCRRRGKPRLYGKSESMSLSHLRRAFPEGEIHIRRPIGINRDRLAPDYGIGKNGTLHPDLS